MTENLNIKALKKKTSITLINFEGEDLLSLKELEKLKKLELIRPNLISLSGIEFLTNLTELKITGAKHLESINGLETLKDQLTTLQITSGALSDFSLLGKLTNLTSLTLSNFQHVKTLSFISELKKLKELKLYHIKKCDSLKYIIDVPHIEQIFITPWDVIVEDNTYLPLTKKLVELGKLRQIIEWEEVDKHLDNEGQKIYKDYFNISELQYIKRDFNFNTYEDDCPSFVKENCDRVDNIIFNLIEQLENQPELNEKQKLDLIKTTVLSINKLDDAITKYTLISTGEREILCDALDKIATAVGIDVEKYDGDISIKWRTW